MKILIVKPSSLGDVIHALPVLRLLKAHLPSSQIYWWIETSLAPLLEDDPDLTGLIHFERRGWKAGSFWSNFFRQLQWVRHQAFDWVIDLQCLARSGVFSWLANGKLLVGLDEPREGARGFYDRIARRPSFYTHAVDWYLGVLPLLGVPSDRKYDWLPPRVKAAASLRQRWPIDASRWLILQPGARWTNKRWPAESFAALVRDFPDSAGEFRFAVLGSEADQPLGEAITRAAPTRCLDLTGRLTLPEMIEWIRAGELMVSNDTGPMHVAAALGKPVVALCGPTEPRRTGPYRQLNHVLQLDLPCVPCLKPRCHYAQPLECLRALSPATVLRKVLEILGT